jgi:hypothetical protein
MPLGIVVQGDSLCTHPPVGTKGEITVADLVGQIMSQAPGYTAEIRSGTVFVHPFEMKPSVQRTLMLAISRFSSEPDDAQSLGITLWMYVRGILVPNEGSAFVGGTQRAEALPAIELTNTTVLDVLDHIVTLKTGSVWIMHQPPDDWESHPKTNPFEIWSYSGQMHAPGAIACSK